MVQVSAPARACIMGASFCRHDLLCAFRDFDEYWFLFGLGELRGIFHYENYLRLLHDFTQGSFDGARALVTPSIDRHA